MVPIPVLNGWELDLAFLYRCGRVERQLKNRKPRYPVDDIFLLLFSIRGMPFVGILQFNVRLETIGISRVGQLQ